jgi:hypothetical protein
MYKENCIYQIDKSINLLIETKEKNRITYLKEGIKNMAYSTVQ